MHAADGTPTLGPCAGKPLESEVLRHIESRFWSKVAQTDDDECWEWLASVTTSGYGQVHYRRGHLRRNLMAHRVAYELLIGPIPTGMTLDHLCRNKRCVNPAHLEIVTQRENVLRAAGSTAHCKRGHAWTEDNVLFENGSRKCKTCNRRRQAEYRERRRAREARA